MFSLSRRSKSTTAAAVLPLAVPPPIRAVIDRLAQQWRCAPHVAAERIILLALTGWKPQQADILVRLSRFVPAHGDPLPRTCMLLRNHFDAAEIELSEPVREHDRIAWMETLLEALKDRRECGDRAVLADLLAEGPLGGGDV